MGVEVLRMEALLSDYGAWLLIGGMFLLMIFMHRGLGGSGGGCCGGGSSAEGKKTEAAGQKKTRNDSDQSSDSTDRPSAAKCH